MRWILADREMELLKGLSPLTWPVYCFLRSRMDERTGVSCASLRTISEECYVEPGQGKRGTGSPSIAQIRTVIRALSRAGLIEGKSTIYPLKKLIIYMPVALESLTMEGERNGFFQK